MQYIIYIGRNKKGIRDFSQLFKRNIFYSVNDYHKAIPHIEKVDNEEDIIILYERESKEKDIPDIKQIRTKHPRIYLVLATENPLQDDGKEYLKAGINNTIPIETNQQEIDEILQFHEKRRKEHIHKRERYQTFKVFQLPLWKRMFDIIFSSVVIVVLFPVFIITALAICIESRGPVIQKSKRVGTNYLIFDFFRFRTVYSVRNKYVTNFEFDNFNADMDGEIVVISDDFIIPEHDYIMRGTGNNEQTPGQAEEEPKLTKVGRFIRKYSIDDLPQFFNILKGEMSVVGNRPLPLHEAELLTSDDYIDRFMAPAGLTGLWQVEKKGDSNKMSAEERNLLDVKYAKTFSFSLDVEIILRTLTSLVQKED